MQTLQGLGSDQERPLKRGEPRRSSRQVMGQGKGAEGWEGASRKELALRGDVEMQEPSLGPIASSLRAWERKLLGTMVALSSHRI